MDEKVLAAQRWVNATYGNVSGYNRCPENGTTGWATMYSLTRALQHELGITALSDNFGPTTLSRLASRGAIGPNEPKANIRIIVQHALFCKGYWGGDGRGTWDILTQDAVYDLKQNAGLSDTTTVVQPKVFKALLTMDAYVLTPGGSDVVRSIQRWLNGRFFHRSQFFLMPCDGHYSRDVQKALIFGIQYEIGMSDDVANGVFGPGTQAGLRENTLAQGDSGVFVRLFRAGMVFNDASQTFNDSFDAALAEDVLEFQGFSQLALNGRADFATWAQLLVSTGDPTRPAIGSDAITSVTPDRARTLIAQGYWIIGRYLDERPSDRPLNKQIQPGELATIFANDLRVFPISQYYGGEVGYFTYAQGFTDATEAHTAAARYGFDASTVIYFAVDYDATDEEIDSHIIPYFDGVVAGLRSRGRRYRHGVYGSRNVCIRVTEATDARWSFVSGMSTGFSGNMGFPLPRNWAFNQIAEISIGSGAGQIAIDRNVWRSGSDPGTASVGNSGSSVDQFIVWLNEVYSLALDYDRGDPALRVMEYLRADGYNDVAWWALLGTIDHQFVEYVNDSGLERMTRFRDPAAGDLYDVSHFGASCNGVLLKGIPDPRTNFNEADMATWAGDLITFYADWRRAHGRTGVSGFEYCLDELAKIGGENSFANHDMIADIDALEIGTALRFGASLPEELQRVFGSGGQYQHRFRQLWMNRFGSESATFHSIVRKALLGDLGLIMNNGRGKLLGGVTSPGDLPDDDVDDFIRGFEEVISLRIDEEPEGRLRTWRLG
ncbi:putative peptidoglycan binding domain protein [Streptomyces sp. MP131-18]|nr:putative peptidoglycan binding domain protein [Streptomyces sp. MP131-18]